jgi:hypothetical protein
VRASRPHALRGVPRSARPAARRMPRARSSRRGGNSAPFPAAVDGARPSTSESAHRPPRFCTRRSRVLGTTAERPVRAYAPRRLRAFSAAASVQVARGCRDILLDSHLPAARQPPVRGAGCAPARQRALNCSPRVPGAWSGNDKSARRRRYARARPARFRGVRPAPGWGIVALYLQV